MTNFEAVTVMNEAFGNPQGNPSNIDWQRVMSQCKNIMDEFCELIVALGGDKREIDHAKKVFMSSFGMPSDINVDGVRDALCDIHVFAYGAHHLMGLNADHDIHTVVNANMTRFIKDEQDKQETIAKHAAKGVKDVYFEGTYPTMIMKSSVDQPDAPKGKFLKSASFKEPVFYSIEAAILSYNSKQKVRMSTGLSGAFDPVTNA